MKHRFLFSVLITAAVMTVGLVAFWTGLRLLDVYSKSENETIRVGYAIEAPYAFVDEKLQITGEAPETFRLIAKEMGDREIRWIQTSFSSLIPDLISGRIDVIAAGMFVTAERKKLIEFTEPTLTVYSGLMLRGSENITESQLASWMCEPQRKIAVVAGAVEATRIANQCGLRSQLINVPDANTGASMLSEGSVDVFTLSWPTLYWIKANKPTRDVILHRSFLGQVEADFDSTAFGIRKEDVALKESINTAMKKVIGSEEHLAVLSKFGFTTEDIPKTNND